MGNHYQLENDWHGLYLGDTSKDDVLFTPDSVKHPAKMSNRLLARIIDQMQEWGWLRTGDALADPFGGTGRTALYWCALHPDNRGVTIEIEPHFAAMQRANKAHAERKLGRLLRWEIVEGDSRKADEFLGGCVGVTSPPYAEAQSGSNGILENRTKPGGGPRQCLATVSRQAYGDAAGQIANLPDRDIAAVLSPPYGNGVIGKTAIDPKQLVARCPSLKGRNPNGAWFQALATGYVNSPGNIDNLPDMACVTSPPYEGSLASDDPDKRGGLFRDPKRRNDRTLTNGYSAVTSPPYGDVNPAKSSGGIDLHKNWETYRASGGGSSFEAYSAQQAKHSQHYGDTDGQIGRLRDPVAVTSPPYEAQSGGSGPASRASQPDPGVADRCGYKADSNGSADGQIGATQGNRMFALGSRENAPTWPPFWRIDTKQKDGVGVSFIKGDSPCHDLKNPAPNAGNPAGLDVAESATSGSQIQSCILKNETAESVRSAEGSPGPAQPENITGAGKVGMGAGEGLGSNQFTTQQKNGITTPASSVDQQSGSLPTTSSRGSKVAQPPSKISPPSVTPVTEKQTGNSVSPESTAAFFAEIPTSRSERRREPAPPPAGPSSTPPSTTDGLSGNEPKSPPEDYATACLQVYSALARAGVRYLAVVTKNPTRDGKLRRLDKLTARLLRASGYRVVAWRRCWLWETAEQHEERNGQGSLFDAPRERMKPVGRLSFFKRIHLAKGSVAAQFEDVFFCELISE